jgi:hypothetical protein
VNWSDLDFHPSAKSLRQFGGLCALASLAAAGFLFRTGQARLPATTLLIATSLLVATVSLTAPRLLRLPYVALVISTFPIGFVVSRLAIAIAWYLVLTPIALALRIGGRDALERKRHSRGTNWKRCEPRTSGSSYLRQF